MKKQFFKISKWLHKFLGLFLILFLMWESISGVLMNHPEIIANVSMPKWLVPSQYHIKNWNRSALTKIIFSEKNPQQAFTCGKQGVWETLDSGYTFHPFMDGYSESKYYLKTSDIYLHETDNKRILFAGSNEGLFIRNLDLEIWKKVSLNNEDEAVKKFIKKENDLIVFTESNAFKTDLGKAPYHFEQVQLYRNDKVKKVTLVDLFFHLHDGRIWGFPGKLLFDLVGIIIFILCISAFYTWYFPKMVKRKRKNRKPLNQFVKKSYRFLFKYHLKLGIWATVITIIIAGTGFFLRPPMLVAIANGSIEAKYYPGFLSENPWHEKIQNALYDPIEEKIIIATSEGLYSGKSDFTSPFIKDSLNTPIFVMGATVFDAKGVEGYLIGSFSGLFHLERETGKSINILTNKEVENVSNIRPSTEMVTGYFQTPNGEEYITAHEQGLLPINNVKTSDRFSMPKELSANYSMPLWNYLFEIHNGRFFKDLIGDFYILLVPFGSLFFFIITITGVYDWLYIRPKKEK